MRSEKKYTTASGMRAALEERLSRMSKDTGQDIMRLRRHVAFDRFLSRLFAGPRADLVVKGGYALELRLKNLRTTKDIDISVKRNLKAMKKDKALSVPEILQSRLQEWSSINQGDFFEFAVGKPVLDLENAPSGGYRFPVEVRMAGRIFIRFEIDLAAGDVWMEPHDIVRSQDWFGFAGIKAPKIPIISMEQQFAEKLHSYSLPRQTPNSRVKDIFDLLVLIRQGTMDYGRLTKCVSRTFQRRKTHGFPPVFHDPPDNWAKPFEKYALECNLTIGLKQAVDVVRGFCDEHSLIS